MKTELEKLMAGGLYVCDDEINERLARTRLLAKEYNATNERETDKRKALLKQILGSCPEAITILPDVQFDHGVNTHIGENFFANFGMIILDVNKVSIGNNVMFGPRVSIFSAGHPTEKNIRREQLEYGYPVTIGDDVWIGGCSVVNPGVTIGEGTVIGSGSVVTKDIPANVVAAGNPCRVIRKIEQKDIEYWQAQKEAWQKD